MKIDFTDQEFTNVVISVQNHMTKENLEEYIFKYKDQNYKSTKTIRQIYEFQITEIA